MTLDEIEKRLRGIDTQFANNSPNYKNSIVNQAKSNGQNIGQYIVPNNRIVIDNRVGTNLQRNNMNPQITMKAPVSSTINKTLQTIPISSKKKYTFGENASSIFHGVTHLAKPIVKASFNEVLPYYLNTVDNSNNISQEMKNGNIKGVISSAIKGAKDIILTPADFINDKARDIIFNQIEKNGGNAKDFQDAIVKALKEKGKDINSIYDLDLVKEDKYNHLKVNKEELQQMLNNYYDEKTPNKTLAGIASTGSDIALANALQVLGIPQTATYGVMSGAETYGNTNNIKEIAGDAVIGAGTGLISDFATPAIKETAKAIIPNVGKKIAPTLVANYGSNFLSGYMSSYGANTIGQQIKNGSLNITPEQEKEINSNALSFAIFSSLLGGTKDTVLDIKNAKIQLNQDVNNTIEKLKDANAQLERTDYTTNEAIQARLKARGNSIIEDLENNNYLLNNKNKNLAVKMLRTAYDSGNINNINYANNQVIALLGSAEMNSKISQQLSQITNQETANKITIANEKLMQSNIPEETKWNILDEATALYDQTKDVDKMVELIDNRLNNVAIPIQEQVTNQTQAIAPITSESNNTIEGKKGSFFDYSKEKIDNSIVKNAEDIVSTNRNGKRTKEQTLQLAEQIGFNAPADKIDIYAHKTWQELRPYEKLTKGFVSYNQWETRMKEANAKAQSANVAKNAPSTIQDAGVQVGKNSSNPLITEATVENDLAGATHVNYNKNGNSIRVLATDNSGNIIYEGSFSNNNNMTKHLGNSLTDYINKDLLSNDNGEVYIKSTPKEVSETDYMMSHRPTETGAYASDISNNGEFMPQDVYEHPEYYFGNLDKDYSQESLKVLKEIQGNPDAEITIYRATTGNKINKGDWVTPSKKYAEYHNETQLDGKGNVISMKVKASDIQFAGDEINEFGYFPKEVNIIDNDDKKGYNGSNLDLSTVKEGDLVNEYHDALTPKQWVRYHQKMNKIMESTYGNISNTMIVGNKIVTTEIINHKEQVTNVLKVKSESISNLSNFVKEEANKYGYDGREIERTLSKVYGEENVLRYNSSSDKFEPITDRDSDNRKINSRDITDERIPIQTENRGNNRATSKELEKSSSFSLPIKQGNIKTVPTAEDLKKSMIDNSSKEAQEVLNNDKIEVKQGRTNSKVVSNDDNIQVSRSGNIYPEGNKITAKEYVTTGEDEHYKKGDTRFIPIDSKHADKGYVTQKWDGEKWIDADDYNDFDKLLEDNGIDSTPPTNNDSNNDSPFDENGKSKTLDFISESRKKDKVKLTELGDFMMQKWVNKGHYVDKLAEKTNNPNLKYAYDKTLSTYGEANYSIGVAQTDNNGKEIGKSIIDIFKPSRKANLYNEFNDYLINRHRLDRQALGKAVYNESVTSEDSRKIIETYEKNHPEFKEWAEDVYKFNRNELHNLVEEGFISKETEEYLHEIYGDYVPLHRDIIEVATQAEDARKTGAINPIKKSTGGSQNILNIEDAMAENVVNNKKAIRRNQLGKELAKSTGNEKIIGDYGVDTSIFSPEAIINVSNNAGVERINGEYLYNIFVDGEMKQFKVDENLFESLRADTADIRLKNKSKALTKYILDPTEKVSKLQRDVLTTYSIGFSLNNPIKDFQDGLFYSKFGPRKFIEGYGKALYQIATKGKYSKEYDALGGLSNSYFEYGKGVKKDSKNPVSKVLEKVRDINEIIEKAPRLSEYINSIEAGMSKTEAMYNASDITTNFKRGGEYAKVINKYGANFFNASIQGLDKTIRTFTGKKAGKAWLRLLVNVASLGIVPTLINSLLYKDDEDYQNLESYIKDEYYLIKMENLPIPNNKNYDGIFIRIPKGRVLSVIGATARRILEGATGGDYDLKGLGQEITNQIAPNNPVKDNVFAPIMQVATNKTWYGSAMVPKRLQNQLPKNQYKEDTDYVSMWLGEQLNISPIKINYLIDQYSGGFGDVFLPMITPKAENNILTDKFTTDSVLKNKNVGEFYDNVDKYEKLNNDLNPTQENTTKYSYLKKVSTKVGELYSQKRNIQMDSTLSDKEKQTLTREIQKEINMYCETANNLVNDKFTDDNKWNMYVDGILSDTVRDSDGSSQLQDALYAVNNGLATKKEYMDVYEKYKANGSSIPTAKVLNTLKENNVKLTNYATYDLATKNYESDKDSSGNTISSSLITKKAKYIYGMNISNSEKNGLLKVIAGNDYNPTVEDMSKLNGDYLTYFQQSGKSNNGTISAREKYMSFVNAEIPITQLNKYYNEIGKIQGTKDANGKTISGSKKQAVFNYVNSLSLNVAQKKLLLSTQYSSFKTQYYQDVFDYVNSLKMTKEEKQKILNDIYS